MTPDRYRVRYGVQAIQFRPESCAAIHEWLGYEHRGDADTCLAGPIEGIGGSLAYHGDWVVLSDHGDWSVVGDEDFRAEFAPAAITLHCPACGINRHWDEGDAIERDGHGHPLDVDRWPGTGMGLACPRCGVEAAPATAEAIVEQLARRWRVGHGGTDCRCRCGHNWPTRTGEQEGGGDG